MLSRSGILPGPDGAPLLDSPPRHPPVGQSRTPLWRPSLSTHALTKTSADPQAVQSGAVHEEASLPLARACPHCQVG